MTDRDPGNISLTAVMALAALFLLTSCVNRQEVKGQKGKKPDRESLMEVNKELVKTEDQKIADFIERYHWNMKETGSGLRYWVYQEGKGPRAETGKTAVLDFTVSLLNGETCYSSDQEGPKTFVIGKSDVESGLNEGILLLREGDRAKFIIPSHLAFGLLGDMKKIPAKAVLVYDVNLLKIK